MPTNNESKVVVITGASSGIGLRTALKLAKDGYTVYGGSRNAPECEELKVPGIKTFALDLTEEKSIDDFAAWVKKSTKNVDALINCAGVGQFGTIEDVPLEKARRAMDVSLFGPARLIQLFVPVMREQGYGRIINVSSVLGRVSTLFGGWYCTSKFAMEGLSDALRAELIPFHIHVSLIEPGLIKTPIGDLTADNLEKNSGHGAYAADVKKAAALIRAEYASDLGSSPEVVADAIVDAVTSEQPKTRYLVGYGAEELVKFRKSVSDEEYDKFIRDRVEKQKKL